MVFNSSLKNISKTVRTGNIRILDRSLSAEMVSGFFKKKKVKRTFTFRKEGDKNKKADVENLVKRALDYFSDGLWKR